MKTLIEIADRQKALRLISRERSINLSETEQGILDNCLVLSQSLWVGMAEGRLVCFWGLIPPTLLSEQAYLWLYATPLIEDYKFLFVRKSQVWIQEALKLYPRIIGHCGIDQHRSIAWLRWLGATFKEAQGKLVPFIIKAK